MPEELETILRLVAEGTLTPEEAAPIIEVLTRAGRAQDHAQSQADRAARHAERVARHIERAEARAEAQLAQAEAQFAQAEAQHQAALTEVQMRCAQSERELATTRTRLDAAHERLAPVADLGPASLRVARGLRRLAQHHPRFAAACKAAARRGLRLLRG